MTTAIVVLAITVFILLIIVLTLTEQLREANRKNRMYADKFAKMLDNKIRLYVEDLEVKDSKEIDKIAEELSDLESRRKK